MTGFILLIPSYLFLISTFRFQISDFKPPLRFPINIAALKTPFKIPLSPKQNQYLAVIKKTIKTTR
jgi:hypothetical protein